ncbi:DUF4145 domain-containing protein [Streptomyces sp. PA03-2a]|uniref:DUF4145 domain-containing protein n=1 Tax=Streptomyces sp. PA03-2a TaxID=3028701 RepID=UPI0029B8DDC1|nr:DUF4145 domain-containing protein [Streptomyces sp. PA03-2a]MDX2733604.1 DUF4145 domain-containing protein [Streptomyces sp. PA03-2a]
MDTEALKAIARGWTDGAWPTIPCPSCARGELGLPDDQHALAQEESWESRDWRKHDHWEPDWIHGQFHGALVCGRTQCREYVAIAGDWRLVEQLDDENRWDGGSYEPLFTPRFFLPALRLLTATPRLEIPASIEERLLAASTVLWAEPSSAGNRVRAAAEALLDDQNVPRTTTTAKGRTQRLTAHSRIVEFRAAGHPEEADLLEAVKWIGNDASHEDSLSVADVLDGVEILEHALRLLYDTRPALLKERATRINQQRGTRPPAAL